MLTKFILGAVGGAAPEVVRLYQARLDTDRRPTNTLFYWVVTALFLLLAGTVAAVTTANNVAALAAGIQTPFVIRGIEAAASTRHGSTGVEELIIGDVPPLSRAVFRFRQQVRLLRLR